ncbi:MAG: hypothetical protein LQ345_001882 [Seirophora villosa]|nr:MAG: hypothetical protein LQ345_001882 [Seirophora villosa]
MLAIPLRSQPDPHLLSSSLTASCPPHQAPPAIQATTTPSANAMISVMPTPRPLTPKRPKLSLQTSTIPTLPAGNKSRTALNILPGTVDSPTTFRNTYDNAFEATPSTPVTANPRADQAFAQLRQPERPLPHPASSSSSISTLSSGPTSPFADTAPYVLALGAKSILRNSPLPRRNLANKTNRPPKRMFQPVKRVAFHESLVEMIPTPILSDSEASIEDREPDDPSVNETTRSVNAKSCDKFDGISGRRKRRGRDWIWRPVNDEASPTLAVYHPTQDSTLKNSGLAAAWPGIKESHEPQQ